MPVYEYVCKSCGHHLEVAQSFQDAPLTTCPACGGPLRKVFSSVGIMFKGSGFYRTDSRLPSGGTKDGPKEAAKEGAKEGAKEPAAAGGEKAAGSGADKAAPAAEKKAESTSSSGSKAAKSGDVAKTA
jgi:putative FmdB family regulatory protein